MLLKAVLSCLHARRPSKGCPGNLTSCISQSVTCQHLHSSNITNIKKKPTNITQRIPQMSLCGAASGPSGGFRYLDIHCCYLLPELWRKPQQAEQVSWAVRRGETHILGFHKRRGLRLNPWAQQLVLEGGGSKWWQPLWSPWSISPLLFLYSH